MAVLSATCLNMERVGNEVLRMVDENTVWPFFM